MRYQTKMGYFKDGQKFEGFKIGDTVRMNKVFEGEPDYLLFIEDFDQDNKGNIYVILNRVDDAKKSYFASVSIDNIYKVEK